MKEENRDRGFVSFGHFVNALPTHGTLGDVSGIQCEFSNRMHRSFAWTQDETKPLFESVISNDYVTYSVRTSQLPWRPMFAVDLTHPRSDWRDRTGFSVSKFVFTARGKL